MLWSFAYLVVRNLFVALVPRDWSPIDVVPVPDLMKDGCAECGLVERDGFAWGIDPQLRLNTRHLRLPSADPLVLSSWFRASSRPTSHPPEMMLRTVPTTISGR